jgi:hypothetical protein
MRRQYSTGARTSLSDGLGQERHPLDHVALLANIAGPGIAEEARLGFARQPLGRQTIVGAHADEETPGEDEDVTTALSHWRQSKGQHSQPVIEILAEHVLAYRSREIGVGGADDPRVHRFRGGGAQASHGFLLEHLEKLGLEGLGQESDLVKEDRPVMCGLEKAGLCPARVGEGPTLETK